MAPVGNTQSMTNAPQTVDELLSMPFTIHLVNAYTNVSVQATVTQFGMEPAEVHAMLRTAHYQLVEKLRAKGVSYADLRPALTPRSDRREVAFIFNSRAISSGDYGYEISKAWIPALMSDGPEKTTIRHGDIIGLPTPAIWQLLEESLVGPDDFPRQSAEFYYVVYMTNLSRTQLASLDASLRGASPAYLGHVDCSAWTPLKTSLPLPQIGLRIGSKLLTDTDDGGTPNQVGYPFEDFGFEVVGVDDILFPIFLESRIDMGVPEWSETDGVINLNALAPLGEPLTALTLQIDERRFEYLTNEEPGHGHGVSLRRAGLLGLDRNALADAILMEVRKGLLFNLRYIDGSREVDGSRIADPALDALMFTVQVEFPDEDGRAQRFQVAVKYSPGDHTGEVVTMFG